MIRKDAEITQTINRIQKILQNVGISTFLYSENFYQQLWYSVRIEIEGMSGIGTNGKGTTYDRAMASAYGEFMERLESGFLLNRLFPTKSGYVYGKKESDFFDVFEMRKEKINTTEVDILCGTNGLSAGNSYYECFIQGSCEIFERYVLKKIYFDKNIKEVLKIVSEEYYKDREIYKYVLAIKKRGYEITIIDCTMNEKVPVLGVLIEHQKMGKYCFALGSDFNFDICVERCITEIFQGKNLDIVFRKHMNSCFSVLKFQERNAQYMESLVSNSGRLPFDILNISETTIQLGKPFVEGEYTNKELMKNVLDVFNTLEEKVYVKDYGWLGFPCLRIYAPNISHIVDDKHIMNIRTNFAQYLHEQLKCEKKDYCMICNVIGEHINSVDGISDLLGICVKDEWEQNSWITDINVFLATVAYLGENYSLAVKCYKKSEIKDEYELYALEIKAQIGNNDSNISNQYLANAISVWEDRARKVHNFMCVDCNRCVLKQGCSYKVWKEIVSKCNVYKEKYSENYEWIIKENISDNSRNL